MERSGYGRGNHALLALAFLIGACNSAPPPDDTAGDTDASPPRRDASPEPVDVGPPPDASTDDAAVSAGNSAPPVVVPPPSPQCVLAVGAQCDGREDCPVGQSCCGRYEPVFFAYSSIQCRSSCTGQNDFEFCHPGETCAGENDVCRTSLIIPYDFIGVCAPPESSVPALTGAAVAGEIACGEATCSAGSEKCCLLSRYDFAAMSSSALPPYCAPLDHRCSCSFEPAPEPDAGPPDAGPPDGGDDEDAG